MEILTPNYTWHIHLWYRTTLVQGIGRFSMRALSSYLPLASCQMHKIVGCASAGSAGNVFPPPRFSDPDMHQGTCVTHVPWCMLGSLTSGFLWSGKNVPDIPGACATRNFTYLVRGSYWNGTRSSVLSSRAHGALHLQHRRPGSHFANIV